jgi:hypothetical protein
VPEILSFRPFTFSGERVRFPLGAPLAAKKRSPRNRNVRGAGTSGGATALNPREQSCEQFGPDRPRSDAILGSRGLAYTFRGYLPDLKSVARTSVTIASGRESTEKRRARSRDGLGDSCAGSAQSPGKFMRRRSSSKRGSLRIGSQPASTFRVVSSPSRISKASSSEANAASASPNWV